MEKRAIEYIFQGEKLKRLGYFSDNNSKQRLVVFGDLTESLEKIAMMNTARITIDGKHCNYLDFKEKINKCGEIVSE